MSPAQMRFDSWNAERQRLSGHLDHLSIRNAIPYLLNYHHLTGFATGVPSDFTPHRRWSADRRQSLMGFAIERRSRRLRVKTEKQPPEGFTPVHDGCPLALHNVFWQQAGKQFPYPRAINGTLYHWMVQLQPFGEDHFTIARKICEPQDWRPNYTTLHRRVSDACAIASLTGSLVLYNGEGAGDSIPEWYHLQSLRLPDGPLPIAQAFQSAGIQGTVTRIDEPLWPLPAWRITGSAETIAGEVTRLAKRNTEVAGARASESLILYPQDGFLVCIYVPRDRGREWVDAFGAKLGAYEVAAGCLVYSAPDRCETLRAGGIHFEEMWEVLRGARPEWSDEL